MIGSELLFIGIFMVFIGFLTIMIGIALSRFQGSESRQEYSGKTEPYRKGTNSEKNRDSSWPYFEKPPAGQAESIIKGGGVIMIGPIPIIFGSDKESAKTAIILAIILMLLSFLILKGWLF